MLSIFKEKSQEVFMIKLSGIIDLTTIQQLMESMDEALAISDQIILDLANVELIDSTGIGYIVRAILTTEGKSIRMAHIPEIIEETFEVMGVNLILSMTNESKV